MVKLLFRKNGAISGPVAPTKTEAKPLILPTLINDLESFSFFPPFKKRYQIIKIPIIGFRKSTFISFAELTSKNLINRNIIKAEIPAPIIAPIENSFIKFFLRYFLKT